MNTRKIRIGNILAASFLLLSLSACNQLPSVNTSSPSESSPLPSAAVDTIGHIAPPTDALKGTVAVPDFLTEEQQLVYLRAFSLYSHMFGGETNAVEYAETLALSSFPPKEYETVVLNERTYLIAQGRYAKWDDFNTVVGAIFTEEFWTRVNTIGDGTEIFTEADGRLCFVDASKGIGRFYNENFQDEFVLTEARDNSISFMLIGHYSDEWPKNGETNEQFEARRKTEYDYTIELPMQMTLEDGIWKFNEFHLAAVEQVDIKS